MGYGSAGGTTSSKVAVILDFYSGFQRNARVKIPAFLRSVTALESLKRMRDFQLYAHAYNDIK